MPRTRRCPWYRSRKVFSLVHMRLGAVLMLCVIALAGCGRKGVETTATTPRRGPGPASLQAAECAAEPSLGLAVAARPGRAVRTARRPETAADGPVARDL